MLYFDIISIMYVIMYLYTMKVINCVVTAFLKKMV